MTERQRVPKVIEGFLSSAPPIFGVRRSLKLVRADARKLSVANCKSRPQAVHVAAGQSPEGD